MSKAMTLSCEQIQQSLRQKANKKVMTRNVLCSPFQVYWPNVKYDVRKDVLNLLSEFFDKYNLQRPKPRSYIKDKKKRKEERDALYAVAPDDIKQLRKHLVIGINGVTKSLEKKELCLLLVDKSAKPALLTNHLISLSAACDCPAAAIPEFSSSVSPLIQVTSATALGFKKAYEGELDDLNDLIAKVAQKLPKVKVPWLQRSGQITDNESDTVESVIEESGKLSTIHEVSENLVDEDMDVIETENNQSMDQEIKKSNEATETENKQSMDQEIKKSNEVVDVNQFYVLKTDTQRRQAIRKGICVSNEPGSVRGSKSELDENSGFIPLEIEAGPCNTHKDKSETNSKPRKRKYEWDKKSDKSKPNVGKKMKRPQFESTNVRKLKGNPNKIKKKKNRNKWK